MSATGSPSPTPVQRAAFGIRARPRLDCGEAPDIDYRRARVIARVLTSRRLKERAKWCDLARALARDAGVTDRLLGQALHWFAMKARRNNKPPDLRP